MKRTAKAHWTGSLKEGKGTLNTENGILNNTKYSFSNRFEEGTMGTNPEELLAAAHAGCFTMAVAAKLNEKGVEATFLNTEASVSMEGMNITNIHLTIRGHVKGINEDDFKMITKDAEKNCLISKILNIPIDSESQFVL